MRFPDNIWCHFTGISAISEVNNDLPLMYLNYLLKLLKCNDSSFLGLLSGPEHKTMRLKMAVIDDASQAFFLRWGARMLTEVIKEGIVSTLKLLSCYPLILQ
jgi:hypothetical protein